MFRIAATVTTMLGLNYWFRAAKKPKLFSVKCEDNQYIIQNIDQLNKKYYPTPWMYNTHLQLIALGLTKKFAPALRYDKVETLNMADGGHTALAWLGYDRAPTTPTIVVLHTITGSPQSMRGFMKDLAQMTGWRVVMCVRRGHADLKLEVPKINTMGSTDDLREQLNLIQQRFPQSPLYGVGISAGSGLLVRYLGEEAEKSVFRAGFAYCPGYNMDEAFQYTQPFYSRLMTKKLIKQFITPNRHQFKHLNTLNQLEQSRNLDDFHKHIYEVSGHGSRQEYFSLSNPFHVFSQVKTPLMILNAEDDPICKKENVDAYIRSNNLIPSSILVTTERGSHCAYYEGWQAKSWANRLIANYFLTIDSKK
ncbi:YheT family hydrolase [Aquirhabdus parva]|uniref:Alpha/beta fold hydrolase n=1 Tax=Aquirhabdus parva TaxID=2283318 RepID=A0A345P5X1_9GAMM|nr:alpha/beta fold hydrolase [Aquirhabdus parva]AXI02680.1 alpha/beta fold hydrolase [Aquirhabdus parva]